MRCPKCQFDHPLQTTECLKCGIVFSRYQVALESAANRSHSDGAMAVSAPPALAEPATAANDALSRTDARTELKYRILALPLALLLARLVAGTPLRMAAAMLAMVLATILMATFYAPRESRLYKSWGLRWGLLVIGALSFMHVFLMWTGPLENLPFGEIEGVNLSDPSLLTEMYGWTVLQMVDRYVRLGTLCLLALLALYIWGLVSAYLELRRSPSSEQQHF